MSSGAVILAVILVIIGIIMLIAGAIMYEREKTSASSGTTWMLIIGGVLLLIIGIGVGLYSRSGNTHKHHTDTYVTYADEMHHPYYSPGQVTSAAPSYGPYVQ